MRFLKFFAALALPFFCQQQACAQNIQVHYDFGRALYSDFDNAHQDRPTVTTTVEMFKPDRWGSTYFFVDMDYKGDGVASAYWEIARELKFWKGPWSVHAEYNGGLNYIHHAYLGGATYTYNNASFTRGLSLSALYKYIDGCNDPNNFQLTAVWYAHFLDGRLSFNGFADFWREKHTDVNGKEHEFVFLTEPQLWVNLNRFPGVAKDFNLSVGTEVEISNDFALRDGLYVVPTLAVKWTF